MISWRSSEPCSFSLSVLPSVIRLRIFFSSPVCQELRTIAKWGKIVTRFKQFWLWPENQISKDLRIQPLIWAHIGCYIKSLNHQRHISVCTTYGKFWMGLLLTSKQWSPELTISHSKRAISNIICIHRDYNPSFMKSLANNPLVPSFDCRCYYLSAVFQLFCLHCQWSL